MSFLKSFSDFFFGFFNRKIFKLLFSYKYQSFFQSFGLERNYFEFKCNALMDDGLSLAFAERHHQNVHIGCEKGDGKSNVRRKK